MSMIGSRLLPLGVAFVGGLVLGEACKSTSKNSDDCSYQEGNATCADRYGGDRPYCGGDCVDSADNDGCVEERPSDDSCYYPCGDDMTAEDDMSCDGSTTMTDTVASTMDTSESDPSGEPTTNDDTATMTDTMTQGSETDTSATSGPTGCEASFECTDPDNPVCEALMCIPCTMAEDPSGACAQKDPTLPVCRDDGQCVQCTASEADACGGETPICDDGTSACVGCTDHEQCASSACDVATGACFDGECVRTVDGDGGADFDNISDAITDGCVIIVHQAGAPYFENVEIDGVTVALLNAVGEVPRVQGETTATISVTGDANAYVQGIVVSGNLQDVGIRVAGAALYVDRTDVSQNADGGLDLQTGAYARVRNCTFGGNGNQFQDHHGLVVNNAMIEMVYTSVAANDGNGADSIACSGGSGEVRNSILVGSDASSVDCDGVTFSNNAIDETIAGNTDVGPLVVDWFSSVPDILLLAPEGVTAFADIAVWNTGDPLVDIEGDERANVDGTSEHAGADLP